MLVTPSKNHGKSNNRDVVDLSLIHIFRAAERAEAAYDRRMYRYKAYYSLDCDNGIENAILMKPQTPEMLLAVSYTHLSCGD